MEEHIIILVIALVILSYGYISNFLARYDISGPMVFTGLGLLFSPLGLNFAQLNIDANMVTVLVEIALVLVLFSDAALLDLGLLKQSWKIPARLLFIGLPITVVAGTIAGKIIFPDMPFLDLLLLALILTPTDAALGKAVVSDPIVPKTVRSTINVESGLNDGIIFPILITVVAAISAGINHEPQGNWMIYVAKQIVFGGLAGAAIGYLGARAQLLCLKKEWMVETYRNLVPIALAILAYYSAEVVSGNGFIAAFFSGLYAGNTSDSVRDHIEDFAESEGELLVLISFFVFGFAFVPVTWDYITLPVVVYALLSLTVLRMLPVILSLLGSKLDFSTMSFIAWFGPRGIASILYALLVAHEFGSIQGYEKLFAVVTLTVLMSIFAHGFSAQPLANWYSKHVAKSSS